MTEQPNSFISKTGIREELANTLQRALTATSRRVVVEEVMRAFGANPDDRTTTVKSLIGKPTPGFNHVAVLRLIEALAYGNHANLVIRKSPPKKRKPTKEVIASQPTGGYAEIKPAEEYEAIIDAQFCPKHDESE